MVGRRGCRGRSIGGSEGSNRGSRGGSCSSSRGQGNHTNSIVGVSASHQPSSDPTTPLSQLRTVPTQNDSLSMSSSRAQETSPIPDISQPEVNTDVEPRTQPPKKGVCGPTRGLQLDAYVAANGKIPLVFDPESRRPSSLMFSAWFSNECGLIARRLAPQQLESCSHMSVEDYNLLVERLESKFIIDKTDKMVNECVENIMGSAYRDMRYERTSYIRKTFGDLSVARNFNNACKDVPKDMSQDDWKFLVTLVASPKFQERSETNKKNRAKLLYVHRGGSKPFVHHKKKNSLGDVNLFKDTHYNQEKGWINDEAEKRYVTMNELLIQHSSDGSQPLSELEITQQVLGHRSGYVRGLGWGPRPSRSNGAESSRAAEERAHQEQVQAKANERINVVEAQNQQLQRGLTLVLSILRATGASIPDSYHC